MAQSAPESTDSIRGVVINSVTRQPIARVLVYSPDNRFAMFTNSEGRFEFTVGKEEPPVDDSNGPAISHVRASAPDRPSILVARKPGYNFDQVSPSQSLQNGVAQDLTLALTPESLIVGTVALPTSEAPDSITVQVFRRQVQDGRSRWFPVGGAQSTSDGQFRFADLTAGTYKLVTQELLDRDPLIIDPLVRDERAQLFGYPPVYYQNAPDFESAATISLAAGQTETVNLSLLKQPYYRIKVPVIFPSGEGPDASNNGLTVAVYAHGRKGPGFSLGYNNADHAIVGMLPNGTYTVEALSPGVSGLQTITVRGAAIDGPAVTLLPNTAIPVTVKEEFTSDDNTGSTMTYSINGRTTTIKGPRRYLNVVLEPADEFGVGQQRSLRDPSRGDDPLAIDGAPAGSYWVRVRSSRGYPASIRSGNLDLEHQPLVVGAGGATSPIEITMRDDMAEISGTVAGVIPAASGSGNIGVLAGVSTSYTSFGGSAARVYCIPLPDSSGQFTEIGVSADGSFVAQGLAPGSYRLLAFDREPRALEYRNPDAMRAYEGKGPIVRLVGGQKEHVELTLISTNDLGSEE